MIEREQISAAHKNYAGKVDVLVISNVSGTGLAYGRVRVEVESAYDEENQEEVVSKVTTIIQDRDHVSTPLGQFNVDRGLSTGQWIGFSTQLGNDQMITQMVILDAVKNVPASAWRNGESVYYKGVLYTVDSGIDSRCYDKDAGVWFRNLNAALAAGGDVTVWVDSDNVIRGMEVSR